MNSNFELEIADLRYQFLHRMIHISFHFPYHEFLHFCDNTFQYFRIVLYHIVVIILFCQMLLPSSHPVKKCFKSYLGQTVTGSSHWNASRALWGGVFCRAAKRAPSICGLLISLVFTPTTGATYSASGSIIAERACLLVVMCVRRPYLALAETARHYCRVNIFWLGLLSNLSLFNSYSTLKICLSFSFKLAKAYHTS